jgi:small subunit ribosomal protein S13
MTQPIPPGSGDDEHMLGHGFYNKHSHEQGKANTYGLPLIIEAINQVDLRQVGSEFRIADYGIGFNTARRILEQTNIDPNLRAKNLTPQQLNEIIHAITNNKIKIEGDLRREVQGNLKRLQSINCYRGIRHRKGLPVRGQRTSTNARTRKGPRKTVGVIRNPEAKAGKV